MSAQSNPAAPEQRTFKLTLAYDGTDFHGWQVQPGKPTIQGEIQSALGRITGESPLPQGSGRTDAGVHALAQVASFPLLAPIPPENLHRALNRTLPASIRIAEVAVVSNPFHARHSARAKTYEYRIFRDSICPPFLARYVYPCHLPIDFDLLQSAAAFFVGEHDFASFSASDPDLAHRDLDATPDGPTTIPPLSTIRTIHSSIWERRSTLDGELWVYRVRGNGFLHHMVRNLVGTMLDAARGQIAVSWIPSILDARSRPQAGPTAPAHGLFLHSVEYDLESSHETK
jgi:tRNA pseudouridine38-40 synthase